MHSGRIGSPGGLTPGSHTTGRTGPYPAVPIRHEPMVRVRTKPKLHPERSHASHRGWLSVSPSRLALAVTTVLHAVRTLPIGSALRRVSPPATLLCNLALRLVSSTTMASADFCHSCSSLSASDAPAVNGRRERQISPGNDTLLHCTTAAFTFTAIPEVFGVLCHLDAPCRPSMRFLSIQLAAFS